MKTTFSTFFFLTLLTLSAPADAQHRHARGRGGKPALPLSGKVVSDDNTPIDFATVYLKGTTFGCTTDSKGIYRLHIPPGTYTLAVSMLGFEAYEKEIEISYGKETRHDVTLRPDAEELEEVVEVSPSPLRSVSPQ